MTWIEKRKEHAEGKREKEGEKQGETNQERKRERTGRGKKGKGALGETSAFVAGRFIINGLVFFVSQHGQVEHRVVKNNLRLCVEKATATTEPRFFPN